ncbi:MAG: T9SS type A sorting domain-containing protein [Saprospiraceae bacterium]|nr:T9SS type A sorting domain-containing protein [Saprospiraceae bacterium]
MKKNILLLFTLLFNVALLKVSAQNCNPDVNPPIHLLKGSFVIFNTSATQFDIEAKELVINAIDDCTDNDKLIHSFSANKLDNVKSLSINDIYPKVVQIYTFDESGNYALGTASINIKSCPLAIACNDEVNISIVPGKSTKISVDMLLAGAVCRDRTYTIERLVSNNVWEALVEVNEQSPAQFQYRVKDNSTGITCWGEIILKSFDCAKVNNFVFNDQTLLIHCSQEIIPEVTGFPFSSSYRILSKPNEKSYTIEISKNCPSITVSYSDKVITGDCANFPLVKIIRTWTALLPNATTITKDQIINFKVALEPSSYLNDRVFNCTDSYPKIPGTDIPTIEETGKPVIDACISSGKYSTNFEDMVFIVQDDECSYSKKVIRKWTSLNWCTGDVYVFNQVIKINCSKDKIKPIPFCLGTINISLDHLGEATLYPSDCNAGSTDNCGILKFAFDKEGNVTSQKFYISDIGVTQSVKLYVIDNAGNYDFCTINVIVSGLNISNKKNIISGNMMNVLLHPLQKVSTNFKFQLQSNNNLYALNLCTPVAGNNYALCIDSSFNVSKGNLIGNYSGKNSILEGVSTLDFVTILRDLFGLAELNKLQKIAADVDCNNSINIFDLLEIRRLILGIDTKFGCSEDVLFYTADLNNPQLIKNVDLNLPATGFDISVVKKGDVTGNVFGLKSDIVSSRNVIPEIYIDDLEMQANQEYDIWLRIPNAVNVFGIQIGQLFDKSKVQIQEISSPYFSMELGKEYVVNDSDWRALLLSNNHESIHISNGIIRLKVLCKVKSTVAEAIYANRYPFPILVIDEDLTLSESNIRPKAVVGTKNFNTDVIDFKIIPNPSNSDIVIKWGGATDENIFFKLIDSKGTTVYLQDKVIDSNGLVIPSSIFPQQGVYFLQIRNGKILVTKKVVRL